MYVKTVKVKLLPSPEQSTYKNKGLLERATATGPHRLASSQLAP